MKHTFTAYFRLSKNCMVFRKFGRTISIEYRPRLNVFDLIYLPDKLNHSMGKKRFVRRIKYRSTDFMRLCGIVVNVLDEANNETQIESLLLELLPDNPCA